MFNGSVGVVTALSLEDSELRVRLDEDEEVGYGFDELDELTHAYAVSIHRSQGSEYPCVVVPVTTSAWLMLRRNLLYTAVSRAKRMVVLVGSRRALAKAVRTHGAGRRYTASPNAYDRDGRLPSQHPACQPQHVPIEPEQRAGISPTGRGEAQATQHLHAPGVPTRHVESPAACTAGTRSLRTHPLRPDARHDLPKRRPHSAQPSIPAKDEAGGSSPPRPTSALTSGNAIPNGTLRGLSMMTLSFTAVPDYGSADGIRHSRTARMATGSRIVRPRIAQAIGDRRSADRHAEACFASEHCRSSRR